jgi:hypothetical protein
MTVEAPPPSLSQALTRLREAAGTPTFRESAEAVRTAMSPPPFRFAATTISSWTRGKSAPRDWDTFEIVLDHLESQAESRVGKQEATSLRKACEDALEAHEKQRQGDSDSHTVADSIADVVAIAVTTLPLLKWTGLAMLGGIIGNTAHEAIKGAVRRRATAEPMTDEDAVLLAETAVRVRCHELGIPQPEELRRDQYQAGDGRWLVAFRVPGQKLQFFVRIPPGRPNDDDVSLDVFIPEEPMSSRREWEFMGKLGREKLSSDKPVGWGERS